jgi:SNF2 family DNA or RNA helicase
VVDKLVIQNNSLSICTNGRIEKITAENVYKTVFEGCVVWAGVNPGKAGLPEGLGVSKYPLKPFLAIEFDAEKKLPVINVIFENSMNKHIYSTCEMTEVDHIIVKDIWYPIDKFRLEKVNVFIDVNKIVLGEITALNKYLKTKILAANSEDLVDLINRQPVFSNEIEVGANSVPSGVEATLYPYQLKGWKWLKFVCSEGMGGLLADEMGLGKTLQVISYISDSRGEGIFPALIVCPGSLVENWSREFKKFAPSVSINKHHGKFRTGSPSELIKEDVVITTYETVVRDNSLFLMIDWGLVVVDEAQNIKNPETKKAQSIKNLSRFSSLAVTGTPMENSLVDIWSIFDFVSPGYLGSVKSFMAKYTNDQESGGLLEPYISPLIMRRVVAEVAKDLPSKIEIPQAIEFSETEAQFYEDIRLDILNNYEKSAALVALVKLRMFCANPAIVKGYSQSDCFFEEFSKFRRFDEIIEEIILRGDKFIVFTSFVEVADRLAHHVSEKYKIFTDVLDGRLAIDLRQNLIDEFSGIDGSAALILNPRAGGSGLNITAANHVIHYNLEWNPALEDQASARAFRRGQNKPVTVHRLFMANSVEELINERLSMKREVAESAVTVTVPDKNNYEEILSALAKSPLIKGDVVR